MRGFAYPAEIKAAAVARLADGERPVHVAADLGIHYDTVRNWQNQSSLHSRRRVTADVPVERVERKCLRCDAPFVAKGRFQRLCQLHRGGD